MSEAEAGQEPQRGAPARSPAPHGSRAPGGAGIPPSRGAPRKVLGPSRQHGLRPFARRALRTRGSGLLRLSPPEPQLRRHRFFDSAPLLSRPGELFQGEEPRGREAAMQQLGGDISASQTRWGEGQLGLRIAQSSPPSSR